MRDIKKSGNLILISSIIIFIIITNIYKDAYSFNSCFFINNSNAQKGSNKNDSTALISYAVQIRACYKNKLSIDNLAKELYLTEPIREDLHKNWYKYSIGSFVKYRDAVRYTKELIKRGNAFKKAFVVCFVNNVRHDNIVFQNNNNNNNGLPGTQYSVQVKTSGKKVPVNLLAKYLDLTEPIRLDTQNGWFKYSYYAGSFDNYKAAAKLRNRLKQEKLSDSCYIVEFMNAGALHAKPVQQAKHVQHEKSSQIDTAALALKLKAKDKSLIQSQEPSKIVNVKGLMLNKNIKNQKSIINNHKSKIVNRKSNQDSLQIAALLRYHRDSLMFDSIKKASERRWLIVKAKEDSMQKQYSAEKGFTPNFVIAAKRNSGKDELVQVLFFFIKLFVINFVLIIILSLIILVYKSINDKKIKELSDKYRNLLAEYIFYEGATDDLPIELREIENDVFKRRILLDQIMKFNKNLYGEAKDRVRELYFKMHLDKDSIKKVKHNRWYIKARGFRQLAQMNITDANNLIEESINSKDDILSFEAQLAMVQLNHKTPFAFLDKLKKKFPLWNQLNIQILVNSNNIEVPEFSKWLNSENEYVVTFALRMIKIFQQQNAFGSIIPLLDHQSEMVRSEAIITIGKLGLNEALIYLRNIYTEQLNGTRILILKSMQSLPDESNIKFLGDLLLDPDNHIKLEAGKALKALGDIGKNRLQLAKMTTDLDNADLIPIVDQILDKRT